MNGWMSGRLKWCVVLLLAAPLLLFAVCVVLFTPDAPWWDDFYAILQYLSYPFPDRLLHIADFHNEHRLVFPRVVFEVFEMAGGERGFPFFWCTVFGDFLLLLYVYAFGRVFSSRIGILGFIPFVWLFLDLANCENTIWTLTAVQSHSVLLFAFLSFFFFSRCGESYGRFVLSLAFAVLATLASAPGLGVWPVLALAALLGGGKRRIRDAVVILVLFALIGGWYLNGFLGAHKAYSGGREFSFVRAVDFTLCFLGNLCPVGWVARVLGVVSIAAIVFLVPRAARFKTDPVFFYLIYLLSIVASGVLLRSDSPGIALASRYEIIAISIFCCEAYMFGGLFQGTGRGGLLFERAVRIAIPLAVAAGCIMPFVAARMLWERKEKIEYGYGVWPEKTDQLVTYDVKRGDEILRSYVQRRSRGK